MAEVGMKFMGDNNGVAEPIKLNENGELKTELTKGYLQPNNIVVAEHEAIPYTNFGNPATSYFFGSNHAVGIYYVNPVDLNAFDNFSLEVKNDLDVPLQVNRIHFYKDTSVAVTSNRTKTITTTLGEPNVLPPIGTGERLIVDERNVPELRNLTAKYVIIELRPRESATTGSVSFKVLGNHNVNQTQEKNTLIKTLYSADIPFDEQDFSIYGTVHYGRTPTISGGAAQPIITDTHPHVDVLIKNKTDVDLILGVRIHSHMYGESAHGIRNEVISNIPVPSGGDIWLRSISEPQLNRVMGIVPNLSSIDGNHPTSGSVGVVIIGSKI